MVCATAGCDQRQRRQGQLQVPVAHVSLAQRGLTATSLCRYSGNHQRVGTDFRITLPVRQYKRVRRSHAMRHFLSESDQISRRSLVRSCGSSGYLGTANVAGRNFDLVDRFNCPTELEKPDCSARRAPFDQPELLTPAGKSEITLDLMSIANSQCAVKCS